MCCVQVTYKHVKVNMSGLITYHVVFGLAISDPPTHRPEPT